MCLYIKYKCYFEHVKAYTNKVNTQMNLPQNEWNWILKSNLFRDWYLAWYYRFWRMFLFKYIDQRSITPSVDISWSNYFTQSLSQRVTHLKPLELGLHSNQWLDHKTTRHNHVIIKTFSFKRKKFSQQWLFVIISFFPFFVFLLKLEYFTIHFSSQQYFCQTTYSLAP